MQENQQKEKGSLRQQLSLWLNSLLNAPPKRQLLVFIGLSLILSLLYELKRSPAKTKAQVLEPSLLRDPIDTLIPKGFVLFPIEILNFSSLDSIIGNLAFIDLYPQNHSEPIARGVRLIRSELDPSHMAVLIPETESSLIAKHGAQFFAVIQGPDHIRTEIKTIPATRKRKILIGGPNE